jgi:hypothetical protein
MPSASLQHWQNHRMPRLLQIDIQCAVSVALVPPNPDLAEENLRAYVVLLSAHFQGFCRDLYTEASQIFVSKVRPSLQVLIQDQFNARRILDQGNPSLDNIARDFNRFRLNLQVELNADPANALRRQHLAALNQWRNVVAHQGTTLPPGAPLSLPMLQVWRQSCDDLTTSLDGIVYNQLRWLLRRKPW